jgi:hypothetical protein
MLSSASPMAFDEFSVGVFDGAGESAGGKVNNCLTGSTPSRERALLIAALDGTSQEPRRRR